MVYNIQYYTLNLIEKKILKSHYYTLQLIICTYPYTMGI